MLSDLFTDRYVQLSDGLSIQNQQISSDIANATHDLTKKSVDDNAIVRVITVITLIYLPLQGVSVSIFDEAILRSLLLTVS